MAAPDPAMEQKYQERLSRYVTALRNGKPDRVPLRPLLAEFTATLCGYSCQQITHDYTLAFDAVVRTGQELDVDALVVNMVWVWTGLSEAVGLTYYAAPGIHIGPDIGFQYREPPEEEAFMKADEYDALIEDPTGFLLETWLPRVAAPVGRIGEPLTRAHSLSMLRGGMNMMAYFNAIPGQIQRMREEAGMPSSIAGILKAPLDIIADKLRGYLGLLSDLETQPAKVQAACEALAPHLYHVALGSSDPTGTVPIGFWMHRGCVPFVHPRTFSEIYWPTLRPIIEELWAHGRQTLFYAEGNWDYHLADFRSLPDRSIVYHVDRGDLVACHRALGDTFCLSGGVPNTLLSQGTPDQVRTRCRDVIEAVGRDGGFIMDADAIVQNDARVENVRAMVEATHEFGEYAGGAAPPVPERDASNAHPGMLDHPDWTRSRVAPGVCVPYEAYRATLPDVPGDEDLIRQVWSATDGLANLYLWQLLLSF